MCKRCQREASPSLNPNSGSNSGYEAQWLFEVPFPSQAVYSSASTQENYMDAMTAPPFRAIPGSRGGRVRTHISQWPKYLSWTIQQIQHAIALWTKKVRTEKDLEGFYKALKFAENGINGIINEVPRVMFGKREIDVLTALRSALSGIQEARQAAQDKELPNAFPGVIKIFLERKVIAQLEVARRAVGLRLVGK